MGSGSQRRPDMAGRSRTEREAPTRARLATTGTGATQAGARAAAVAEQDARSADDSCQTQVTSLTFLWYPPEPRDHLIG